MTLVLHVAIQGISQCVDPEPNECDSGQVRLLKSAVVHTHILHIGMYIFYKSTLQQNICSYDHLLYTLRFK